MDKDILQQFCDTEKSPFREPWSDIKYSYATDGHIAIRVPKLDNVEILDNKLDVTSVIPLEPGEEWFNVDSIMIPIQDIEDIVYENHQAISVGISNFSAMLLCKLSMLKDCKISPTELYKPALINFNGGDGAIMPMKILYGTAIEPYIKG